MKHSERFVCPPHGEDKRRYLWWARRVLEECDAAVVRLSGGTAQSVLIDLPAVPTQGIAYIINEFHTSLRFSLVSCNKESERFVCPPKVASDVYKLRFISPTGGELFSAAAYKFPHSFEVEKTGDQYVYGGKND